MVESSVLSVLEKTSVLVKARWCQGHRFKKMCLWYALMEAAKNSNDDKFDSGYGTAITLVVKQLGKEPAQRARLLGAPSILIQWNDQPGRTKNEVLAVLRAAHQEALNDVETPQKAG